GDSSAITATVAHLRAHHQKIGPHLADLCDQAVLAPSPIASMATTELTPITMPSNVRTVRKTLARSARRAMRRDSLVPAISGTGDRAFSIGPRSKAAGGL